MPRWTWNALHKACREVDRSSPETLQEGLDLIEDLASNSFDINARTGSKNTALHMASGQGYPEVVQHLLALGASPTVVNQNEETPLHHATIGGDASTASLLIKAGVPADAADKNDATALHWLAEEADYIEVLEVLLAANVDANARDKRMDTPLHIAARSGFVAGIPLLIQGGADPTLTNAKGLTPFHSACAVNQSEVVEFFVEELGHFAAAAHPTSDQRETPLHLAAKKKAHSVFDFLLQLENGLAMATDAYGHTPLHVAESVGNDYAVEKLRQVVALVH